MTGNFVCHIWGRRCGSRIELHSHMRTHGSWSTHPLSTGESIMYNPIDNFKTFALIPQVDQSHSEPVHIVRRFRVMQKFQQINMISRNAKFLQSQFQISWFLCYCQFVGTLLQSSRVHFLLPHGRLLIPSEFPCWDPARCWISKL